MMCKYNFVAMCKDDYVTLNLIATDRFLICTLYLYDIWLLCIKNLDKRFCGVIINFTYICRGEKYEKTRQTKIRGVTKTGVLKSQTRQGQKRIISKKRLLRSRGPYSSQIRNASPGVGRTPADLAGRSSIRFFSTIVLPGPEQLQKKWIIWPNTYQARPAQRTQVKRTCCKFYQRTKRPGWHDNFRYTGQTDKREIRYKSPHSQYSKGSNTAEKKIALKIEPAEKAVSKEVSSALCDRYENLRCYVLQASGVPGQVYGLGVMLQKGMLSWIEAMFDHLQIEAVYDNTDFHEVPGILTSVQTEFSRMLAGIVINHNKKEVFK